MSHDDHGHDSGPAKPSNPFFLIGIILMFAFFAVQRGGNSTSTSTSSQAPQAVPTPPIRELTFPGEQGPTYNENILISPGPIPNRVKKPPQVAGIAPWGYAITFATQFSVVRQFLQGDTEQRKHTIKTVNVGPDGPMIEQAMVRLTPGEIQDKNLKLITYVQHMTANHRNCFYDEIGGSSHVPDEGVFQPDAIQWNKLRGGARGLNATMALGTLPLEGYDFYTTLPDESVTPQNGLPCGTQMKGTPIGLYDLGDNEELYNETDENQWSAQQFCKPGDIARYVQCLAEQANCDPDAKKGTKPVRGRGGGECKKCTLTCSDGAHTVFSTRLPAACEVNKDIGYCPDDEKTTEPTGFVYTQVPTEISFEKERNGTNFQDHTLHLRLVCPDCEKTTDMSVYYLEALRRKHLLALNCSLAPSELQDPNNPCPTEEPRPTPQTTPPMGDVCDVAKKYNIPCCQLKGIMQLETEGGTNTGSGSCSTSHGNFQCCHGSACGPAQVLCGQYDGFAGKDKLDMCSQVGAAELLARAMLLKLCQAAGKCDSYDWTTQGNKAKQFKVADGNYTAAAYFYGLQNGCFATPCSQYRWGAGKGYCDSVESYCKTGKVLPDNKSMEFCEACNEEVVRAGQAPIQCTE